MNQNLGDATLHFKGDNKDLEQKTKGLNSSVKNALSGVASTVGGVFATAFSTATAMVTTLTKKAIQSYADLEQNIGGVETLFKNSADKVIKNAQRAYKTAGVSANKYMETVTSFSASLLQSLDGDTEKAVEYSDRAIVDMSDNANKMGTSIEMIQSAYSAFAKQNFTLLDNLKVGYGGTRGEMERLIEDANKVKLAHGEMADLSIESFADITEAIHIIQNEMGITGTTQKEAESTITGSLNALKGAFDNFLNGSGGVEELVDSAVTVIGNLSNAFLKIVPQLASGLTQAIKKLIPQIPGIIKILLPTLLSSILDLTEGIASELPSIVETLMTTAIEVVNQLAEELPTLLPVIIDSIIEGLLKLLDNIDLIIECGYKLILGLIQGVGNALPRVIEKAPDILMSLISGLIFSMGMVIEYAPQIIVALVQGIVGALGKIFELGGQIIGKLWDGITSFFGWLWDNVKSIPGKIGDAILSGISALWDVGKAIVEGVWDGISGAFDWLWDKVCDFFGGIVDGVLDFLGIGSPSKLFADEIGQWIPKGLAVGIEANTDSVQKAIDDMNDIVVSSFDLQPDVAGISSTYSPNTIVNVYSNYEVDPLGQVVSNIKTYSGGAKNDFNYGGGIA